MIQLAHTGAVMSVEVMVLLQVINTVKILLSEPTVKISTLLRSRTVRERMKNTTAEPRELNDESQITP